MNLRLPSAKRLGFPYTAPSWPGAVERPPVERKTGSDFDTAWARRYGVRMARAAVLDNITKPVVTALASPEIDGTERLTTLDNPVIFAANHMSHLDTPLLLTSLPQRFRHRTAVAGAADYFFDKRWKGALLAFAINAFPIERTRISPRSTRLAIQLLDAGWSLLIFPEGGRSPDGWAQEHRAGAGYLSQRNNVPIVPVHLGGTRRVLRKGAKGITPSTTRVTFGTPLRSAEGEDVRAFAARVEHAIAVLADEQDTDWWTARRRAAQGETPVLTGPTAAPWRRNWELRENRRKPTKRRWP